ncbi:hypothetical protein BDB00DRAFT_876751 [Zychaea mexicana]|uniref:uncharacterized protein n=1 Tax=Zychaea mexicana TaxID=64656 RepID=UPI0022FE18EE|nr:uncharacterized protein BDB00DRAFT_876751 [Zychaea mexicana]KAI9489081.1 hypothetical protein BDB00DRAFT_876751 [Zychaea mexicana]
MSSTVTRWEHHHSQTPPPRKKRTSTTNIQLPSAQSPPVTVTLTDVILFTTHDTTTITTTTHDLYTIKTVQNSNDNDVPHQLHQLLPVLGLFAVIGLLAVLGLLGYMAYRFYRSSNNRRRCNNNNNNNNSNMEWPSSSGREPMEFENSASDLKAQFAPASWPAVMQQEKRPLRLDSPVENSEQPISSTFVPINTSPLTLVPRMEVWEDPQRRRGVDELDMWEKKQQQKQQQQSLQEDSPRSSSETVQAVSTQPESHIAIARNALERTRIENSSSQWLRPTGSSRSL